MDDEQRRQLLFGTTAHRRPVPNVSSGGLSNNATSTGTGRGMSGPLASSGTAPTIGPSTGLTGTGVLGTGSRGLTESEMIEAENDQRVDKLRGHIGQMRHLALDIGNEVRDQNALLEGMSGSFDKAGHSIRHTITLVRRLASNGGGGHMCILFVFAFIFFVLIYFLLR